MRSPVGLERDIVIVACAISAGVHAALVRDHLEEGAAAGSGFVAAAVLLTGLVVALTYQPASPGVVAAAGAVLAGLLASYAFAATTGIPLLHPEPEPVDPLALATKAIEALGLAAALHSIGRGRPAVARSVVQTKEVQT